jgi:hypothetical protein
MTQYFTSLYGDLQKAGDIRLIDASNEILIASYAGVNFNPEIILRTSERDLEEYLSHMRASGETVFPDAPSEVGAYRLLLIHLDAALTADSGRTLKRVNIQGKSMENIYFESAPRLVDEGDPNKYIGWSLNPVHPPSA